VVAVVHNVNSALFYLLCKRFPTFNLYHHYSFEKRNLGLLAAAESYEVIGVHSTRDWYSLRFFAALLPGARDPIRRQLAPIPSKFGIGNIAIVARQSALRGPS
jgi:hypothetical protein